MSYLARILICEDDEIMRTILSYHLRMEGIELVFAIDGKEGIKALNEQEPFDLIISDLLMPELSGIEFIRHVRTVRNEKTPIVVISGAENLEEMEEAHRIGIDDFVAKPFRPQEIAFRIKTLLIKSYPEKFSIATF